MLTTLAQVAPLPHAAPWGGLLAAYFTLIGIPSGLTLATWWHRSRFPTASLSLDWRTTWLGLLLLSGAGLLLTVDLGRPGRFFLMLTKFGNWDSPISLGAKIIAVKTFLLAVALYLLWRRRTASEGAPAPLPALGTAKYLDNAVVWLLGFTSVALAVYPISVLARTWVSPLASTSGSALIFLVTSLLMGAAVLQLVQTWDPEATTLQAAVHRRATLVLLMTYAAALAFTAVSVPNGPAKQALESVFKGEWAPLFYAGAIGLGLIVPLALLTLVRDGRWTRLTAAAAILAGTAAVRYLIFTA
ncbi:NrfD/PsrC family molybdoenzyme membrane anchor subunit [Streptomyces sp. NPDC002845]